MKRVLNYILLPSLIFIIVACKKNSPTESNLTDSVKYHSVSGTVFDVINNDDSHDVKMSVPIILDGDTTVSNAEGKFTFNKVLEGNHIIKISLQNYEPYSKTISVTKDTTVAIYLISLIKYYSVSGIVFDVISSDYSPGIKKDAPIYIDNNSTISGSDGRFIFNKISEGSHTVIVTLPNYEPFSRTITVLSDTNLSIYLYGKKEDFFPIKENSFIKFNYSSSSSDGVSSVSDSGDATWSISTSKQVDDSKVYEVVESIIYTRKIYGPIYSEKLDTSSTFFTISINNSDVVSFKSSVLNGVSFNRYLDPRQEQGGVIIKNYNNPGPLISTINISLKKNVGLYKIVQFGNRWGKTYELIQ